MIQTWIADVRSLCEKDVYEKYYHSAPVFRQEKADHIKDWKKKAQSIGAWILYEKMRRAYQVSEEGIYNLSHSGDFVLCSLDDEEEKNVKVGCDLEEIKGLHSKLVQKYFLPNESAFILGKSTERERVDAFYRYWVLKESFMKATRLGMKLGLNTFEIQIDDGNTPMLLKHPMSKKEQYFLKEYDLDLPYKVGVCATKNKFAEEMQKIVL